MNLQLILLAAIAGAAAMYVLDPDMGRRRQAMLRNQATSKVSKAEDELESKGRHISNVAKGKVSEARGQMQHMGDTLHAEMGNQR